jgi:hypothetical protein
MSAEIIDFAQYKFANEQRQKAKLEALHETLKDVIESLPSDEHYGYFPEPSSYAPLTCNVFSPIPMTYVYEDTSCPTCGKGNYEE